MLVFKRQWLAGFRKQQHKGMTGAMNLWTTFSCSGSKNYHQIVAISVKKRNISMLFYWWRCYNVEIFLFKMQFFGSCEQRCFSFFTTTVIPSLSSKRGHVTGKHAVSGCKRDKFCLQSFEVWEMFMQVFQEWWQDWTSKTFSW